MGAATPPTSARHSPMFTEYPELRIAATSPSSVLIEALGGVLIEHFGNRVFPKRRNEYASNTLPVAVQ